MKLRVPVSLWFKLGSSPCVPSRHSVLAVKIRKMINTALLSFGMSGSVFHAPFIHAHKGFHLHGAWERSKKIIEEKYPGTKSYPTYEELLADPDIHLVVVNTPNYTHYEYTKKALLASKHVIVEKPFTVTVKEGEELIQIAKDQNKKLSVYHNRRYDSDYVTVAKVLKNGLLGEIVEAELHYDRYRLELSYKQHKENAGPGTGALYDLGSHLIDQALQLFGKPDAVFADILTLRPSSEVDDFFELLFYYSDKRVRLRCSYIVREPVSASVIHGRKGSFVKPRGDVQETELQDGKKPGRPGWGKEDDSTKGILHTESDDIVIRKIIASEKGNYMGYYEQMHDAIVNDKPVPVSAEDAVDVIRIIEAAFLSSQQQKVVRPEF